MDTSFRDNQQNSTSANVSNGVDTQAKPQGSFAEKAEDYKQQATTQIKDAVSNLQEKKDQVVEKLQSSCEEATATVRANPWPFVVGAAVAGLLLGLAVGSCRSPKKGCSLCRD